MRKYRQRKTICCAVIHLQRAAEKWRENCEPPILVTRKGEKWGREKKSLWGRMLLKCRFLKNLQQWALRLLIITLTPRKFSQMIDSPRCLTELEWKEGYIVSESSKLVLIWVVFVFAHRVLHKRVAFPDATRHTSLQFTVIKVPVPECASANGKLSETRREKKAKELLIIKMLQTNECLCWKSYFWMDFLPDFCVNYIFVWFSSEKFANWKARVCGLFWINKIRGKGKGWKTPKNWHQRDKLQKNMISQFTTWDHHESDCVKLDSEHTNIGKFVQIFVHSLFVPCCNLTDTPLRGSRRILSLLIEKESAALFSLGCNWNKLQQRGVVVICGELTAPPPSPGMEGFGEEEEEDDNEVPVTQI